MNSVLAGLLTCLVLSGTEKSTLLKCEVNALSNNKYKTTAVSLVIDDDYDDDDDYVAEFYYADMMMLMMTQSVPCGFAGRCGDGYNRGRRKTTCAQQ